MQVTVAKDQILAEMDSVMVSDITILLTDIMVIINQAWERSFARVHTNKKPIAYC
jgi:hypothetical protein